MVCTPPSPSAILVIEIDCSAVVSSSIAEGSDTASVVGMSLTETMAMVTLAVEEVSLPPPVVPSPSTRTIEAVRALHNASPESRILHLLAFEKADKQKDQILH